jgi:hypothetical protein
MERRKLAEAKAEADGEEAVEIRRRRDGARLESLPVMAEALDRDNSGALRTVVHAPEHSEVSRMAGLQLLIQESLFTMESRMASRIATIQVWRHQGLILACYRRVYRI